MNDLSLQFCFILSKFVCKNMSNEVGGVLCNIISA